MRLTYKQKLVQILRICDEYHGKSRSRIWLKNKLREAIASLDSFNSREKAELYKTAFDTAVNTVTVPATAGGRSTPDFSDSKNCKDLVQVMGKLERHTDSRDKAKRIKDTIARSRNNVTDDPGKLPIIFYACSRHSSPANDHKDYQGAIYVDRYWRRYTVGMMPEWIVAAVEDYIEKKGTFRCFAFGNDIQRGQPAVALRQTPYIPCFQFLDYRCRKRRIAFRSHDDYADRRYIPHW